MTVSTRPRPAAGSRPPAGGPRRRRSRRIWAAVLAVVLVAAVAPGVSYARALTYPGSASWSVRSVEWLREHGGAHLVDTVENWYYGHHQPSATGRPSDGLVSPLPQSGSGAGAATGAAASGSASAATAPPVRLLSGVPALAGEGVWGRAAPTSPLWTTWFRPDRRHLPVVVGAALVPAGSAQLHLAPGTRQPVLGTAPALAQVPAAQLGRLVATFNSGFKMKDSHGGWFLDGRTFVPLRPGRASLVVTRSGGWLVGAWGTGPGRLSLTPDVVAVRQNLDLVVDRGHVVPGLTSNASGRWGTAHTQFQYTWRSGIGTDARGDLIYVAGQGLTLATLADAMWRAGVVEGMQLDIHPAMVSFNVVDHASAAGVRTHTLLRGMRSSARRYLSPDQRDFLYLTAV